MNLSDYVKKRNGVPIGHSNSLRNNFYRSLGAKNFSTFWNFWNPIFGYYLGSKIFKPLKKVLPIGFAVVLTFIFCGFIHDLVTTLLRGKLSLFFTIWFFLLGTAVVLSKYSNYDFSNKNWIFRAFTNLSIIGICLLLTLYLNTIFKFY
ncbi:MBOAT family O-acyltransferase [Flavobacterium sp. UBA6135]|uniref:MBOAT family O-acyltransferase n=1 Tax=Flavobacterium sp. UBA6135 TaxID=1946553 RepID=UPI0025C15C7F|nr:MBOAT family O-acyltransferase [Flavobacterium sp. UBA6135]